MSDASTAPAVPVRVWPAALIALAYWVHRYAVVQTDMPMFNRFMSNTLGSAAFLLLFLIFWLANGTVRGRVRLAGLGALLGAAGLGIVLRHRSFDPFGFVLMSVPYVLTAWTIGMGLTRIRGRSMAAAPLAAGLLACFLVFDLLRWEGVDGRLRSSVSLRGTGTAEQAFLASKAAPAAPVPGRTWSLQPGDCPEFRGALRDGTVRGIRLAAGWKEKAPELVWKQPVGPGWSSMIVVDGFLVTQEQRGDSEAVVCYDAASGKELWSRLEAGRFSEGLAGPGPRATPTFHAGRLYALGAAGRLSCLDASDGKSLWTRDVAQESSTALPMWGFSSSPLVVDGKVVVFVGGARAFDAASGAPLWSRPGKESYSSAQLFSVGGKPQIVIHDNQKLCGLAVADGAVLWERPGPGENSVPMLQPHAAGEGALLATHGPGVALWSLREEAGKWTTRETWSTLRFRPSYNDFVLHEGRIYGLDDGVLTCVDASTGERVWRSGRYGYGQLLLVADEGVLIVLSEKGELAFVEAKPQEPGEVVRLQAIEGKTWNHPILVRDRLYVRNGAEMACFRVPIRVPVRP